MSDGDGRVEGSYPSGSSAFSWRRTESVTQEILVLSESVILQNALEGIHNSESWKISEGWEERN